MIVSMQKDASFRTTNEAGLITRDYNFSDSRNWGKKITTQGPPGLQSESRTLLGQLVRLYLKKTRISVVENLPSMGKALVLLPGVF